MVCEYSFFIGFNCQDESFDYKGRNVGFDFESFLIFLIYFEQKEFRLIVQVKSGLKESKVENKNSFELNLFFYFLKSPLLIVILIHYRSLNFLYLNPIQNQN